MAQYKKYNKYIFSGIDWLGDVPELWIKRKLTWIFGVIGSGTTPTTSNADYYDGDIPWLITGDLNDGIINVTSKTVTDLALAEFSALKLFPENSLVMAMYGATIGKLGLTKIKTTTNQACCVMANPINADLLYLFFWLLGNRKEIINLSQGGGQPNISQSIIRSLRLYCPPIEEQTMIAKFLDKKTSEIDSLIADKEKLIKLLEEQRLAIITEAVTKGLNPNVKMKDSGVEWIADIPNHWRIKKLKYVTNQIIDGTHSTPNYQNEVIPVLRVTDITSSINGEIDLESVKYITPDEHKQLIRRCYPHKGDLLVSKNGTIGIPKVIDWDYDFSIFVSLCLIKTNETFTSSYYLKYFFESSLVDEQIAFGGKKNTITNLHLDKIKEFILFLPPNDEQQEIIEFLNTEMREIGDFITQINKQIALLNEYRQSLIFEAVTGKIDVRDSTVE